ncbi:putative F-box domain-containing protein [Medicago truncatula]|uniref:Putative F-box domain-containing protein n=1 Tax=Medicago truncatula TaxID=3880 RepID=A0A396HDH2_MEDTR|nr:putative F-box domain-containing protein [Medicago truncatula]
MSLWVLLFIRCSTFTILSDVGHITHTCKSTAPTSLLLDELIVEFLSRLPVKTLMQFKCVCKSWKTLISHDPSFAKCIFSDRGTHTSHWFHTRPCLRTSLILVSYLSQ